MVLTESDIADIQGKFGPDSTLVLQLYTSYDEGTYADYDVLTYEQIDLLGEPLKTFSLIKHKQTQEEKIQIALENHAIDYNWQITNKGSK